MDKTQVDGIDKNFYKRNYIDALNIITPKIYFTEDASLSGYQYSPVDTLIDSHITLAGSIQSIFNISSVYSGSAFDSLSGTSQYFIKQNDITNITTQEFEVKILKPLGYSLSDFKNEAEFSDFVESTLIPNIRLNSPNYLFNQGTQASAHDYLLKNLSWLYILNTSAAGGLAFQPSSLVYTKLVSSLYYGTPVKLNDALKDVATFIWKNYSTCSVYQSLGLIPNNFVSSTGKYTSGTQSLENLHTLIDITYSPLFSDRKDERVKDAFDLYIATNKFPKSQVIAGPFTKFLTALSYSMYDIDDQINKLNILYDIDKCPVEFLPRLADLIGWQLLGTNTDKWRTQLRYAMSIYKAKGTKRGLNLLLESAFGENSFDLSSQITELYESYIPNMLYYCLATESNMLSGFDSWTLDKSRSFGILHYSTTSMDLNIKYVVDTIIKEAIDLYPQNFFIGNTPFNPNDLYDYRGFIYSFPPWELEKYYRYCRVDNRLVTFLGDKLSCLGVPQYMINNFSNHILDNTIYSQNEIGYKSNWLFFTSGINFPANKEKILKNFDKEKTKYLPIWNSKSSTFNLALQASSFEFDRYSRSIYSSEGLKTILRAVNDYTPAHAIPDVDLILSASETAGYDLSSTTKIEFSASSDIFFASTTPAGFARIGSNLSSLGRSFGRTSVDSLLDPVFSGIALSGLDRTSTRRRNLKYNLPKDGWYNRSGFNMPGYMAPSSFKNYSTYIPLGYIPSACKFETVPFVSSIPDIYSRCEDLNSTNAYYGYSVSNTFPCRGIDYSASVLYATRGDCEDIIPVIHKRYDKSAYDAASSLLLSASTVSSINKSPFIFDVPRSLANSTINNSTLDESYFYDFEFGNGVHKLYESYTKDFGYHDLTLDSERYSGSFNVFAHTYGPLLYNANLDINGSALNTYPELITSSYGQEVELNNYYGSGIFSPLGTASGTYIASSLSDLYINKYEFRNPHLISGVELITPSGDNQNNYFAIIKIDPQFQTENFEDYAIDNCILKMKLYNSTGLPRFKFNLKDYGPNSNKFVREHEFMLNVPFFIGQRTGSKYGGNGVGVWIHTEPESGYIWSWTPKYRWQIDPVTSLTPNYIRNNLSFLSYIPLTSVDLTTSSAACVESEQASLTLRNMQSKYFKSDSIYINTLNRLICIPNYYNQGAQVHREDQSYSVEVFCLPDVTGETYALFDNISCVDTTLNGYTNEFSEDDLLKILLFFRTTAQNLGSRVISTTSGVMGPQGGSRLEYRYHPKFGSYTEASSVYTKIDISR